MGSTVILDLMGGIALLLWGLHMVHSGIVRAFGADLRRLLGIALQGRIRAFLAGAFVTAILQSGTATGLMAASFVTGGTLGLVPALAVMLGANVGIADDARHAFHGGKFRRRDGRGAAGDDDARVGAFAMQAADGRGAPGASTPP